MKKILKIPCGEYSCCCIPDVEFKRTPKFPVGSPTGSERKVLHMQILIPRPTNRTKEYKAFPIVLHICGGGWQRPQVKYRLPALARLAERGLIVASAEYRGSEEGCSSQDMVEDVRSAIRYVREHAREYGGDPDAIVLMGDSAGAHLSMLSAYGDKEFDSKEDDLEISTEVSGVIELFGPTDLKWAIEHIEEGSENLPMITSYKMETFVKMGGGCAEPEKLAEKLKPWSPIHYVSKAGRIPPTLIGQGDADPIVPAGHAEILYEALTNAGKDVEYYRLEQATHGDWRFYEDEMMDIYAAFVRRVTRS